MEHVARPAPSTLRNASIWTARDGGWGLWDHGKSAEPMLGCSDLFPAWNKLFRALRGEPGTSDGEVQGGVEARWLGRDKRRMELRSAISVGSVRLPIDAPQCTLATKIRKQT